MKDAVKLPEADDSFGEKQTIGSRRFFTRFAANRSNKCRESGAKDGGEKCRPKGTRLHGLLTACAISCGAETRRLGDVGKRRMNLVLPGRMVVASWCTSRRLGYGEREPGLCSIARARRRSKPPAAWRRLAKHETPQQRRRWWRSFFRPPIGEGRGRDARR